MKNHTSTEFMRTVCVSSDVIKKEYGAEIVHFVHKVQRTFL